MQNHRPDSTPVRIDARGVCQIMSYSQKTLKRRLDAGEFPKPAVREGCKNYWRYSTVVEFANKTMEGTG